LTSRGCVGAGLLGVTVTSTAGASPPRLIDAILAAATGQPPAAVAALAKGTVVNGIALHRWALAALFFVGAAALGIALGRGTPTAAGPLPDKPAMANPAPADEPLMTVAGRVLGTDGKPRAGVALTLAGNHCAPLS